MRKMGKYLITALVLTALMAIFAFSANAADLDWDNQSNYYRYADGTVTVVEVSGSYDHDLTSYGNTLLSGTTSLKIIITEDVTASAGFYARATYPVVIEGREQGDGTYPVVTAGKTNIVQTYKGASMSIINLNFDMACLTLDEDGTMINVKKADGTDKQQRFAYMNGEGTLTLENVHVENAWSNGVGAGICVLAGDMLTMTNCSLANCYAPAASNGGGAVYIDSGIAFLDNVTIDNCESVYMGGGVYVTNGALAINGGSIMNCKAPGGAGVTVINSTATISGVSFSDNKVNAEGNVVYVGKNAELAIDGVKFSGNKAGEADVEKPVTLGDGAIVAVGEEVDTEQILADADNKFYVLKELNSSVLSEIDYTITDSALSGTTDVQVGNAQFAGFAYLVKEEIVLPKTLVVNTSEKVAVIYGAAGGKFSPAVDGVWNQTTGNYVGTINTYNPMVEIKGGELTTSTVIFSGKGTTQGLSVDKNATLNLSKGTVLKDFYYAENGAALFVKGTANCTTAYIVDNTAKRAAAIVVYPANTEETVGGTCTINGASFIARNTATSGPSAIGVYNGSLTLDGGTITRNKGSYYGTVRLLSAASYFTINGGKITANTTTANNATDYAGGVQMLDGVLTINGGEISSHSGGSSARGAGVFMSKGTLVMTGGKITGNTAGNRGGGIYAANGTINIQGGEISNNKAGAGAGITVQEKAKLTITGGVIKGNKATNYGGAIYIYAATNPVTIKNATISNNEITGTHNGSGYGGAAIMVEGSSTVGITVDISDTAITGNASGTKRAGGAISLQGGANKLNLGDETVITGNSTQHTMGGGIIVGSTSSMTITGNVVVDENTISGGTEDNIFLQTTGVGLTASDYFCGNISVNDINKVALDSGVTNVSGIYVGETQYVYKDGALNALEDGEELVFINTLGTNVKTYILTGNPIVPEVNTLSSQLKVEHDAMYFVGVVDVTGFGTNEVAANALYKAGDVITVADIKGDLYAVWVKVETLIGASAQVSANSGIKFFTKVDSAALESVGINVKSADAAGDGYSRGTLLATSASDLSNGLSKEIENSVKMDVKVNNDGWIDASKYGINLSEDESVFAATVIYGSDKYYNNAVAYRGYIEITVGDKPVTVYSDFVAPESMENSADTDFGNSHARSACAVVRTNFFGENNEVLSDTQVEAIVATYGEEKAAVIISNMYKIAGYEQPAEA